MKNFAEVKTGLIGTVIGAVIGVYGAIIGGSMMGTISHWNFLKQFRVKTVAKII